MEITSTLLSPEKLNKEKVELVMELVKGKEYANQLQAILHKVVYENEGLALAEELAQKVVRSFSDSLAKVSLCRTKDVGLIKNSREKDFEDGCKKRPAEMVKDKRGSYKRRKEVASWVIVSPTAEDGYAWRKYGQKLIQNSLHPRCYFRCTHKTDQACKALKQVQEVEGQGEIMYQTTYLGQHTCSDQRKKRGSITSYAEVPEHTSVINFSRNMPETKSLQHVIPRNNSFVPLIIEQESNGDTQSDLTDHLSSIDSKAMWPSVVGSLDYSPGIGSFHDQEVASSFYGGDASISLEGFDISGPFFDFPFEEI